MAKAFSVASWNVEHFGISRKINGKKETKTEINKRITRVAEYVKTVDADITALYEVTGSQVFSKFRKTFPTHQFFITEGIQTQEILIMTKPELNVFITQKTEFKTGSSYLRPGALVTVTVDDINYMVLFLHLKSLTDPKGFGLRDDMLNRAVNFRGKLLKTIREEIKSENNLPTLPAANEVDPPNFIFLGDLNIMGMDYWGSTNDISATEEMKNLDLLCKRKSVQMRRLTKSEPHTYRKDSKVESDLDHVIASNQLNFKQFNNASVNVIGWPQEPNDNTKDKWKADYSDHALLYFEVEKI